MNPKAKELFLLSLDKPCRFADFLLLGASGLSDIEVNEIRGQNPFPIEVKKVVTLQVCESPTWSPWRLITKVNSHAIRPRFTQTMWLQGLPCESFPGE